MLKSQHECIEYIHSLSKFGKKAGLSNITKLCSALGNPQDKLKFIHVAGTNGKGSVCSFIQNVLSLKYKVGLYTSPYIEEFNERIQIDGKKIDEQSLVYYTNKVKKACESLKNFHPIEFEFITAMGFLFFLEQKCDYVVLEVGLGGRFDATNIIKTPVVSVITSIGLDHVSILGDTISKIAFEKCGIIKNNVPLAIYHKNEKGALEVIKNEACKKGARIISPLSQNAHDIELTPFGSQFVYKSKKYSIGLSGKFQVDNAVLAIDVLTGIDEFNISTDDIEKGLSNTSWKCRCEVYDGEKINKGLVILDGSHNCQGVKALFDTLFLLGENKRKIFVFGMLNEKDFSESIENIKREENSVVIVTDVPSIRQTDGELIYNKVKEIRQETLYIRDCKKALIKAIELMGKNDILCIFGSLYLAGELRSEIRKILKKE